MNAKTVVDEFVPNLTIGRTGYVDQISDWLYERMRHLDALMCLVTAVGNGADANGFRNCNVEIQTEVLNLAASLATEIHELHDQDSHDRSAKSTAKAGGGCNASQS